MWAHGQLHDFSVIAEIIADIKTGRNATTSSKRTVAPQKQEKWCFRWLVLILITYYTKWSLVTWTPTKKLNRCLRYLMLENEFRDRYKLHLAAFSSQSLLTTRKQGSKKWKIQMKVKTEKKGIAEWRKDPRIATWPIYSGNLSFGQKNTHVY